MEVLLLRKSYVLIDQKGIEFKRNNLSKIRRLNFEDIKEMKIINILVTATLDITPKDKKAHRSIFILSITAGRKNLKIIQKELLPKINNIN